MSSLFQVSLSLAVSDKIVPALVERISALTGAASHPKCIESASFFEHERVFSSPGNPSPLIRIRREKRELIWTILHIGQPQPPKPGQITSISAVHESKIYDGNITEFLTLLGYNLSFEFVRKGFRFWFGALCISVCCIHKVEKGKDRSTLVPLDALGAWLVELTMDRTGMENVPAASEELLRFAHDLRGLIDLPKPEKLGI